MSDYGLGLEAELIMSNKQEAKTPKNRNWIAVAAHFKTGAGSHGSKKTYNRKAKHKKQTDY